MRKSETMNDMARSGVMIRRENSDSVTAEEAAVLASFDDIVVITWGPCKGVALYRSVIRGSGDKRCVRVAGCCGLSLENEVSS